MNKIVFKCPVCNGTGKVQAGFYTQTSGQWSISNLMPEKCRSCKGAGIVWKKEKKDNEHFTFKKYGDPIDCIKNEHMQP